MELKARELVLKDGITCMLRHLTGEDGKAAVAFLRQTAEESPYLLRLPEEVTMTEVSEAEFLAGRAASPDELYLGAFRGGEMVGMASLSRIGSFQKVSHRGDFSIALTRSVQGLGLGEAVLSTVLAAAPRMGILQVELSVMASNRRAIALYEKLGFRLWGTLPGAYRFPDGRVEDENYMVRTL